MLQYRRALAEARIGRVPPPRPVRHIPARRQRYGVRDRRPRLRWRRRRTSRSRDCCSSVVAVFDVGRPAVPSPADAGTRGAGERTGRGGGDDVRRDVELENAKGRVGCEGEYRRRDDEPSHRRRRITILRAAAVTPPIILHIPPPPTPARGGGGPGGGDLGAAAVGRALHRRPAAAICRTIARRKKGRGRTRTKRATVFVVCKSKNGSSLAWSVGSLSLGGTRTSLPCRLRTIQLGLQFFRLS